MTDIKKALVTGAGGFIGSHLVEALLERGAAVKALVRYNSRNHWGWLEASRGRLGRGLEVVAGDVRDPHQMLDAVAGCDAVFHLAALIGIPYSVHAPASYIETNVAGTQNVATAAVRHGVKAFIHTSTSETYGTAQYEPMDEKHPLQPHSPYAASKVAADKLVESFRHTYDLPAVTVRPFNTYGPRQSARAVIPTIITQALSGKTVRLGSLDPVRDLTFVADTVAGFLAAADRGVQAGGVYNLGFGSAVSVGELAKTVFQITGTDCRIETDPARVRGAGMEVMRLVSDNRRAREELGWAPRVGLREGLERTVGWIRDNLGDYKPELYNV